MLKVGECQGYIDEDCVNCGRHRVEHYSKGFDICENAVGVNNLIVIFLMKNFMMKKKIILGYPN